MFRNYSTASSHDHGEIWNNIHIVHLVHFEIIFFITAVLAAGAPEHAPFMADESMLAIPGQSPLAYTEAAYKRYNAEVQDCVKRLKKEGNLCVCDNIDTHFGGRIAPPHKQS